ncbi:hypothetical protein QVD17_38801 [Tagetes erecta]|uniref:Uncharacterized protein n=1 Tax=Tagetes erecta TaxID=13708 RepID=A0AAD8JPK1_TARER|nr:hypothetical protein QVD17_38801 [Tagetes erecta]
MLILCISFTNTEIREREDMVWERRQPNTMIGEAMAVVVVVRLVLDMSVIIINDDDEGPKDIQRKRKSLPRNPLPSSP